MLNKKVTLLQVIQEASRKEKFSVIVDYLLQVSKKLLQLAAEGGPDEQGFSKLAKDVEQFVFSLVDPLKADYGNREVFGAGVDRLVDEAIERDQKKVKRLNHRFNHHQPLHQSKTIFLIVLVNITFIIRCFTHFK